MPVFAGCCGVTGIKNCAVTGRQSASALWQWLSLLLSHITPCRKWIFSYNCIPTKSSLFYKTPCFSIIISIWNFNRWNRWCLHEGFSQHCCNQLSCYWRQMCVGVQKDLFKHAKVKWQNINTRSKPIAGKATKTQWHEYLEEKNKLNQNGLNKGNNDNIKQVSTTKTH